MGLIRLMRWLMGEAFILSFDKGGSSAPPAAPVAPDPSVQIQAQAKALPSVFSPHGSAVYSGDPNVTGSFRQDITLSPAEQQKLDAKNLIANQLLYRTGSAISSIPNNFSYSGKKLNDTFQFSGATDPATNRFFTAQKALLDPVWKQNEERERQRLSNQGIPEGSEAYNEALREFSLNRDASYEQASANALDKGFGQALSTRGQQFNEAGQDFAQDIGTRQQNLNEIAQALGGTQLNPITGAGGNPLDVSGAFANQQAAQNRQYQGQLAGYNADVASKNSMMGGLFGLGAASIPVMFSDRRLKRDVVDLGEIMPGIHLYEYAYVWGPERHRGVMADEVERVMPEAVLYDADGFQMVDYGRLFGDRVVH